MRTNLSRGDQHLQKALLLRKKISKKIYNPLWLTSPDLLVPPETDVVILKDPRGIRNPGEVCCVCICEVGCSLGKEKVRPEKVFFCIRQNWKGKDRAFGKCHD